MDYDVFLVGNASMDFIFTGLPRMPVLGEDTFSDGFGLVPGEAYTNAVALHRLGVRVAWAADFGNDRISQLILEYIRNEGLSEEFFVFHDRPFRRVSISASFRTERAFITHYDTEPDIVAAIKALPKVNADFLFIPGLFESKIFEAALSIIKLKKLRIILDGNCPGEMNLTSKGIQRTIRSAEVFLPNAKEARSLTGLENLVEAAKKLSEFCPLVIIKDGCNGSIAFDRSQALRMPAIPISPIDTTGAGDCFSSGFLKAYSEGLPIPDCMQWANIVGGLSTLGYGGTSYHVDTKIVAKKIQEHYCK